MTGPKLTNRLHLALSLMTSIAALVVLLGPVGWHPWHVLVLALVGLPWVFSSAVQSRGHRMTLGEIYRRYREDDQPPRNLPWDGAVRALVLGALLVMWLRMPG